MSNLHGAKIHITGIVQGVGFRPFIHGLAARLGLSGWIRNTSAGVDIELDGKMEELDAFFQALRTELPPLARVDKLEYHIGSPSRFKSFEILQSEVIEGGFQAISPDVCICPDCLQELFNPNNRRFRYPFINCTNCGPRFTIISDIPYDRPNTTMAPFEMCLDCSAEYQNPQDRRFHAQPIACPVCGPKVWLELANDKTQKVKEGEDAILTAQMILVEGKILAIKGLGGFHLACDATNKKAVTELRERKLRVDKPFALMVADLVTAERHCVLNLAEREMLESRLRPIALLSQKPESNIASEVAPKQNTFGVMLPYTPLHYLLLNSENKNLAALVMTSGNISEEPIATGNNEARERLSTLADGFLMNDRDIYTRCDDSVARIFENKPVIFRRSRSYAPDSIPFPVESPSLLATGPELKNTFCLTRERYAFLSHHIGDIENYETLHSFESGIDHYESLFRIQPKAIAYDNHPDYLSTRYAIKRAEREKLPAFGIQHHHAHIAACMVDNGLEGDRPVLGVAFDGTGYGVDGAIWGGEFLIADYLSFERRFHLAYFPLPGGDAAIKRPARTALSLLWSLGLDWDKELAPCKGMLNNELVSLRTQLEHHLNTTQTSSMGRLFDAVASLAGVRQAVNYEAQAAIEFEAAVDKHESEAYHFEIDEATVNAQPVINGLLEDIQKRATLPIISARFHNGLADLIRRVCIQIRLETKINGIALSGGVWQNMTLLELTVNGLRAEGFNVFIHRQVPTNDGGLSLGQAVVAASKLCLGK